MVEGGNDGEESWNGGGTGADMAVEKAGMTGFLEGAGASCQNQDLRDYGIFRIFPSARIRTASACLLIHIRLGGILGYGEKRKPVNPDSDKDARSSERRKVKPAAANPLWEKARMNARRAPARLRGRDARLPSNPNLPPQTHQREWICRPQIRALGSREKFAKAPVRRATGRTVGESRRSLLSHLSENRGSAIFSRAIDIAAPSAYHVSTA